MYPCVVCNKSATIYLSFLRKYKLVVIFFCYQSLYLQAHRLVDHSSYILGSCQFLFKSKSVSQSDNNKPIVSSLAKCGVFKYTGSSRQPHARLGFLNFIRHRFPELPTRNLSRDQKQHAHTRNKYLPIHYQYLSGSQSRKDGRLNSALNYQRLLNSALINHRRSFLI